MTIVPFLYRVNAFVLNPLIGLAFGLSFVYFTYGVIKFLTLDASADKSRKEARDAIMWGIIGMIIMFSVFGIIRFVLATFGISPNDPSLNSGANQFINLGR